MTGKLIEKVADGYRLPGLVDAHVHIESSHLRPAMFGRLLARNGTFAAVCDPHEIVNVCGEDGLRFMLADARRSPARLHFALPSCVPSSPFETSGATIDAAETARLLDAYPEIVALGEMMNYPGVLAGDAEALAKIAAAAARGKRVDGHFPGARGEDVWRYAAAGITSDHETLDAQEALYKVTAGMRVFIREGSAAKNLERILPAVQDDNWRHFCFCTDDMSADDLAHGGGILDCVRKAVRLGLDPERAVAMASVIPAEHYGLTPDPDAYFVVKDLVDFEIVRVVPPRPPAAEPPAVDETPLRRSVILPPLDRLAFPVAEAESRGLAIGARTTSIVSDRDILAKGDDYRRLAVIERHGRGGRIGYAPIVGVGPLHGAVASTIGHDAHNVIVMGDGDADMRAAVARLAEIGGGAAVVRDGAVLADFALPLGGLMSDGSAEAVTAADAALKAAAHAIGCTLPEPLTTLSFLALPVVPHLKLTDRGLVDVDQWKFI